MTAFSNARVAVIFYVSAVIALVFMATASIIKDGCSATLQACLGSCVESQLLDVVKESIRIKR